MSKTNHCKEIGMNNQMIRVLSLALCLVMVLGLTACGSQQAAPAQETQSAQSTQNTQTSQSGSASSSSAASEYAWKSTFLPIALKDDTPIQPVLFTDDGIYATGQITLGRREPVEGEVEEYEG